MCLYLSAVHFVLLRLLVAPVQCPVDPLELFPSASRLSNALLHPLAVGMLSKWLRGPEVAATLNVRPFTLREVHEVLPHLLPPRWAGGTSLSVAWQDGRQGGPTPEKLDWLWRLLLAVHEAHPAVGWHVIDGWPLIPCSGGGGTMVRMAHRHLVTCPPQPPAAVHLSASQEAVFNSDAASMSENGAVGSPQNSEAISQELHSSAAGQNAEIQPFTEGVQLSEGSGGRTAASDGDEHTSLLQGTDLSDSAGSQQRAPVPGIRQVDEPAGSAVSQQKQQQQRQQQAIRSPWSWFLPLCGRLGVPVLDERHAMLEKLCTLEGGLSEQDVLLRKLQLCQQAGIFQVCLIMALHHTFCFMMRLCCDLTLRELSVAVQVDQLGDQDCTELFNFFVSEVPQRAEAPHVDFLRSLPIFSTLLPSRRVAIRSVPDATSTLPRSVLSGAGINDIADLPEALQACVSHSPQSPSYAQRTLSYLMIDN